MNGWCALWPKSSKVIYQVYYQARTLNGNMWFIKGSYKTPAALDGLVLLVY